MTTTNQSETVQLERGWRKGLSNVALAVMAAFLALLVAEMGFRFLALGRPPALPSLENPDLFIRSANAELVYELHPGFVGRAFGAEVRINSHGMRSPERPMAKPKDVRRVLILGDSVAFGHGVEQSAMFSVLLEKSLSDAMTSGIRVEVINTAVPGYNSVQERMVLHEKGFAWQPDVVLVVAVINDVEPIYEFTAQNGLWWENPPEVYREIFEREVIGRGVRGWLRRHVRVFGLLDRAVRPPYLLTKRYLAYLGGLYEADSAPWRSAQEALVAMDVMCRARGIRYVLAYCPVPAQPEPEVFGRIRSQYADFARREGITFFDLRAAQTRRPVREVTISSLDRHPSVLGHKLLAEALTPSLAQELSRARPIRPLAKSSAK